MESGWREIFGEYARWDSDKTAKTGFVGFGSTYLGHFQKFFSVLPGVGGLYRGGIFLRSAPIIAAGPKGGLVHPKNLWWACARGDQRPEFIADW
jgi:hypothetical protein